MKPNQDSTVSKPTETTPISQERLRQLYWYKRAANCLTGGEIHLQGNLRLREPLRPEHIKPPLLGQWETLSGLSFIHALLQRLIQDMGGESDPRRTNVASLENK
jgi:xylulose-5-phosphate/fructose-6-phosphate phosphoketolase